MKKYLLILLGFYTSYAISQSGQVCMDSALFYKDKANFNRSLQWAQKCYSTTSTPEERLRSLELLSQLHDECGNYISEIQCLSELASLATHIKDKKYKWSRFQSHCDIAELYISIKEFSKTDSLISILKQEGYGGIKKTTIDDLQTELWMAQNKWAKIELVYIHDLFLRVKRDLHFGSYDQAERNIEQALASYKDPHSKKYTENFIQCFSAIKLLLSVNEEDWDYSEKFNIDTVFHKACIHFETHYGKDSFDYMAMLLAMAKEYKEAGRENVSDSLLKEVYAKSQSIMGKYNALAADALNKMAESFSDKGYPSNAQKLFDQTEILAAEAYGKTTIAYVMLLEAYLVFDIQQGRTSDGKSKYTLIYPVIVKEHGMRSNNYAIIVYCNSRLNHNDEDYNESVKLVKSAIAINEANGVDCNPCFVNLLISLADNYIKMADWSKAEATYREAWDFIDNHPQEFKDPIYLLSIRRSLADFYVVCKALNATNQLTYYPDDSLTERNGKNVYVSITSDDKAFTDHTIEKVYDENIAYYTRRYSSKHPEIAELKYLKAFYYWTKQDRFNASREFKESLDLSIEYAEKYLPYLGEKEKTEFYSTINSHFDSFYAFAFEQIHKTMYVSEKDLYFYKNKMGSDTVNYVFLRDTVFSAKMSKYTSPKRTFSDDKLWIAIKENTFSRVLDYRLATKGIIFNTTQNLKKRILSSGDTSIIRSYNEWEQIHYQLAELYTSSSKDTMHRVSKIDSLEKKSTFLQIDLFERSALFKNNNSKDISSWQDVKRNLRAGEAAVEIIRFMHPLGSVRGFKDSVCYAAMIVTPETKENPEVILFQNGNDMEHRFYNYYLNAIKQKISDEKSYDIYWSDINRSLTGKKIVYFSPDGIYNLINLSSLKNNYGRYLLEEIDIRLITDLKDIKNPISKQSYSDKAIIVGDPDFNRGNASGSSDTIQERSIHIDNLLRGGIDDLPGTRMETDQVAHLLSENNWNVRLLQRTMASEKQIKAVKDIRLLHLATHGFFIKESGKNIVENPLLRSGLLFAGAASPDHLFQEEDNILTAYEAMNLDLANTEIVILSACETGQGEIRNGDGVYGLQRAFRTAGSRNIIMSLWKVNDAVTSELMAAFYTAWIRTGDKRGAFRVAQLQIKNKYPEPYYWAAFVLVSSGE